MKNNLKEPSNEYFDSRGMCVIFQMLKIGKYGVGGGKTALISTTYGTCRLKKRPPIIDGILKLPDYSFFRRKCII